LEPTDRLDANHFVVDLTRIARVGHHFPHRRACQLKRCEDQENGGDGFHAPSLLLSQSAHASAIAAARLRPRADAASSMRARSAGAIVRLIACFRELAGGDTFAALGSTGRAATGAAAGGVFASGAPDMKASTFFASASGGRLVIPI
jgi:hypothetical protein